MQPQHMVYHFKCLKIRLINKNTNEWIYAISGRVNNRSIWSEWDMNGSRRDIKVSGQFFK